MARPSAPAHGVGGRFFLFTATTTRRLDPRAHPRERKLVVAAHRCLGNDARRAFDAVDHAAQPADRASIVAAHERHASIVVEPSGHHLGTARRRLHRMERKRLRDSISYGTISHLDVEVRVNISSTQDAIPDAADGVGLVRTEMMFTGRLTAPSESEQLAALLLVAAKARGRPIIVRLFDAGADKPVPWLGGGNGPSRGIRRLRAYPEVFTTQLRALARAREHADISVLRPFVRTAEDVNAVRECAASTLRVGAMIESPDGVEAAESIVSAADFISIGTNDLTATALGLERTANVPRSHPQVLALVRRVIGAAHARGRRAAICGEMAGDERGAQMAVGVGADVLSVACARLATIRRALSGTTAQSCRAQAKAWIEDRAARAMGR